MQGWGAATTNTQYLANLTPHHSSLSHSHMYSVVPQLAFPLNVRENYHHQVPGTGIITQSLLTLRGERFIINRLYLHRAWEFYTNSTD